MKIKRELRQNLMSFNVYTVDGDLFEMEPMSYRDATSLAAAIQDAREDYEARGIDNNGLEIKLVEVEKGKAKARFIEANIHSLRSLGKERG